MKNAVHKSTLVDIGVILYIKVLWWILGLLGVISCRACSRERLPDGHIGNAATLKIFCFLFFYFANIAEAAVQHFEFHLHADNFSQRECRLCYSIVVIWALWIPHSVEIILLSSGAAFNNTSGGQILTLGCRVGAGGQSSHLITNQRHLPAPHIAGRLKSHKTVSSPGSSKV